MQRGQDWLSSSRSLHIQEERQVGLISAGFPKVWLGIRNLSQIRRTVRHHWNQASWSPLRLSWGFVSPHSIFGFILEGPAWQSGTLSSSESTPLFCSSPLNFKLCLYSTDFFKFSILKTIKNKKTKALLVIMCASRNSAQLLFKTLKSEFPRKHLGWAMGVEWRAVAWVVALPHIWDHMFLR